MSSRFNGNERKYAVAKRQYALDRLELRSPSSPRAAPVGPTSAPIKVVDESIRRLVDAALASKIHR